MSSRDVPPRIFLSHAGVDRDAAVALARRLEDSPEGKRQGLTVWVDARGASGGLGLRLGENWQAQIEREIGASTAFAVLVPPTGVPFWVDIEMRLAINRVAVAHLSGEGYPFIPIAPLGGNLDTLPPIARLFQAALVPLDRGLEPILAAALRLETGARVALIDEPFLGLRTFEAEQAAIFFGRETETDELAARLKSRSLVMVVSESGAGKSSLVRAGLVPRFREGCFADDLGRRAETSEWHVVEMRPGPDPFEALVDAISNAARGSEWKYDSLRHGRWIRSREPKGIRDALHDTRRPGSKLLLVVDQFEELWTLTPESLRGPFVDALLDLAPEGNFTVRVVGTMRRDCFPLCQEHPVLWDRIDAGPTGGRFLLSRMAPKDLRKAIVGPLSLAGVPKDDATGLADVVVRDVTDQPGDLALLEMALTRCWSERGHYGGDLRKAYEQIGRVDGALAAAAENAYANPLKRPELVGPSERRTAEALFMRLVRAGNAGGATRRVARRDQLSVAMWAVATKLASGDCSRLLVVGSKCSRSTSHPSTGQGADGADEPTVELAHEQLITQWPRYQRWLRDSADDPRRAEDKQLFDRLMDAAERWHTRGRHIDYLVRGGELGDFSRLTSDRDSWLISRELDLVSVSKEQLDADVARARRRRLVGWVGLGSSALICLAAAVIATTLWRQSEQRAVALEAKFLWDPLQSGGESWRDEHAALRALSAARPAVKDVFLVELLRNDALAQRFCRAPTAITHALVGLDEEHRRAVVRRLADPRIESGSRDDFILLARGLLHSLAETDEIEPVLAAVASLDRQQRQVDAFDSGRRFGDARRVLGEALRSLPSRIDADRAARAVQSIGESAIELEDLQDVSPASRICMVGLCARVSDAQVGATSVLLLDAVARCKTLTELSALVDGISGLFPRLSHAQGTDAISALCNRLARSVDPDEGSVLARGLEEVATQCPADLASPALEQLLDAILGTANPSALDGLRRAVAALAGRLSDEQAALAIESALSRMARTSDSTQADALGNGLCHLAARLGEQQAAAFVQSVVSAIDAADRPDRHEALGYGLAWLAERLAGETASVAAQTIRSAMAETDSSSKLAALGSGLAVLVKHLEDEQAEAAIRSIFLAAQLTTESPFLIDPLTSAVSLLSDSLDHTQAARATDAFVTGITSSRDGSRAHMLAVRLAVLLDRLGEEVAAPAVERIMVALPLASDLDQRDALATCLVALAPRLNSEQAARAFEAGVAAAARLPDRMTILSTDHESYDFHGARQGMLASGLAMTVRRLDEERCLSAWERILEGLLSSPSWDAEYTLCGTLTAAFDCLDGEQRQHAVERLIATMSASWASAERSSCLDVVLAGSAASLTTEQAARAIEALVDLSIKRNRPAGYLGRPDNPVVQLAGRLNDEQALQTVALLMAAKENANEFDYFDVGRALSWVCEGLRDEQAAVVVDRLLATFGNAEGAKDGATVALTALSSRLTEAQANRAHEFLLDRVESVASRLLRYSWVDCLTAASGRVDRQRAARAVEPLLAAIARSGDADICAGLGRALAATTGRLSEAQAVAVIEPILDALAEGSDPAHVEALAMGLLELTSHLPTDQAGTVILRALEVPTIATGGARAHLERTFRERFALEVPSDELGRWPLINWARDRFSYVSPTAAWAPSN